MATYKVEITDEFERVTIDDQVYGGVLPILVRRLVDAHVQKIVIEVMPDKDNSVESIVKAARSEFDSPHYRD